MMWSESAAEWKIQPEIPDRNHQLPETAPLHIILVLVQRMPCGHKSLN